MLRILVSDSMSTALRLHLIIVFNFLISIISASPVKTIISGSIPGGAGRTLRVYGYTNQITFKPEKITSFKISENDSFSFDIQIEKGEVKTIFFAVERFKSFDLYAEAGKLYRLSFDSLDFDSQDDLISSLNAANQQLVYHIDDQEDLNNLITELVVEFVRFSVEDFSEVVKMHNVRKLDEFRVRLDSLFGKIKHPFFKVVLEYSLAEIEFNARLKNNSYFVGRYFNDRPFHYENPAFMNFFNSFFDKFVYSASRKISFSDLEQNIVTKPDYKALLDSLGKDTLLKNEVVRDMVLIKNLHQMYFANILDRSDVYNMMKTISEQSKFSKNRQIALSLLREMTLHFQKQNAPPLLARKANGDPFSLDSLDRKYLYLFFFTTNSKICYPEMIVLNNMYPKFSTFINIVFVSMDVNFLRFYYFMKDYSYPWHFVNFYRNFDIEDDWGVNVYPQAFMIDPDMKIIDINAPLPSEYLEKYFNDLLKQRNTGN